MNTIRTIERGQSQPGVTPVRFLRQPEVLARVGVTWITILRWEKLGKFPRRRKLGPNTVAWVESEIDDWCANQVCGEQGGEGR